MLQVPHEASSMYFLAHVYMPNLDTMAEFYVTFFFGFIALSIIDPPSDLDFTHPNSAKVS